MTFPTDTWPAVTLFWLIEGVAFFGLLQWSWRRHVPGVSAFRGLLFGSMLYVTAEAFCLVIDVPAIRYWLTGISFLGVGIIIPNLAALFADFTGRNHWLTRKRRNGLYAFGIGLGLLRFTDPLAGLIYNSEVLLHEHGLVLCKYTPGVLNYVFMTAILAAMILGLVNIVLAWRDSARLMRRHLVVLGLACLFPVITNALFDAGIKPWGWLNPTPFSLVATFSLVSWAIFHDRLVEVVPIARNYLVDHFHDGVLVVDPTRTIVDTNPALRAMLHISENETLGQPVATVVKHWPALAEICTQDSSCKLELQPQIGSEQYWEASWHPLTSANSQQQGFLLMLTDISARKRTESQLHDLVAERTKEWRRATSSMLRTADEEKRKVGRSLRENLFKELTRAEQDAVALVASFAESQSQPNQVEQLTELSRQIAEISRQVQDFAMILEGPDLAHQTFREALSTAVASLQATFKLKCVLNIARDFPTPSRERGLHIIAIVREAIVNASRHAKARFIIIDLVNRAEGDTITIANDGELFPAKDKLAEGLGIRQMRMHTALLNGRLTFRPGQFDGGVVELFAPPPSTETNPGFFQV